MRTFHRLNHELYAEQCALTTIAEHYGTPSYVYSRAAIEQAFCAYQQPLIDAGQPHRICYAVKANSNIAVLNILARLGAGFDIVSIGELERVMAAGGDPATVVFSGVAKTATDMKQALKAGIDCFNIESAEELEILSQVANALQTIARISVRVNPDIAAQSHPYIVTGLKENKFGVPIEQALAVYQRAAVLPNIEIVGVDCHIGSQLTEIAPFLEALTIVLHLVEQLADHGITIKHLDLGGGLGVRYRDEQPPTPTDYVQAILAHMGPRDLTLIFEPGRSIVANAGVLLTRVDYIKCTPHKNFVIVDAGMNDMLRPALYQAWLPVEPVTARTSGESKFYDIVGPVCETGDFLAKDRELMVQNGDWLAIGGSGAYGFVMSSHYNSRPCAAELMVDGDTTHVIRARESVVDLMRGEALLP